MFVNRMRVGSMVSRLVSTGLRRFGGGSATALWALGIGINTGYRSGTMWYDNVLGVASQHPFSDLM